MTVARLAHGSRARPWWRRIACLLAVFAVLSVPPAQSAVGSFVDVVPTVTAEARAILRAQLPDGAITEGVGGRRVVPYLAHFAALGLAAATEVTGDEQYARAAWEWLDWYARHQDDRGFVTDYLLDGGQLRSLGDMDSTDAYAGMFLLATHAAYRVTQDESRLASLHDAVRDAVRAIEATQDVDGLTWTKPAWRVKYLMDQAETHAGLLAAAALAGEMGDDGLATRAAGDAARLRAGVKGLWNPTTQAYDWAIHADRHGHPTDWRVFYPDSSEQVWVVAFGLSDVHARALMDRFVAWQPQWDQPCAQAVHQVAGRLTMGPVGQWPVIGWAMARLGRIEAAGRAAASMATAASTCRPFTPAEAGQWIVLVTGFDPLQRRL